MAKAGNRWRATRANGPQCCRGGPGSAWAGAAERHVERRGTQGGGGAGGGDAADGAGDPRLRGRGRMSGRGGGCGAAGVSCTDARIAL
eukprot:1644684-Prymnesium_polylepis.1